MRIHKAITPTLLIICLLNCSSSIHKSFLMIKSDSPSIKLYGKYLYLDDNIMEGIVVEHYASGEMKRQSKYKNGLLNGPVITWYPEGNRESVRFYNEGEKDGVHTSWWPNGNMRFEYQFSNGLYHGTFKEWYQNGKPLHVFKYNHGAEVSAIGWRDNGKTYINFIVRNGKKYGLTNARLCYSLKEEQGIYQSSNN
jgi:antitoxin component YwqK of YwqJK toxin-antitoxin module